MIPLWLLASIISYTLSFIIFLFIDKAYYEDMSWKRFIIISYGGYFVLYIVVYLIIEAVWYFEKDNIAPEQENSV